MGHWGLTGFWITECGAGPLLHLCPQGCTLPPVLQMSQHHHVYVGPAGMPSRDPPPGQPSRTGSLSHGGLGASGRFLIPCESHGAVSFPNATLCPTSALPPLPTHPPTADAPAHKAPDQGAGGGLGHSSEVPSYPGTLQEKTQGCHSFPTRVSGLIWLATAAQGWESDTSPLAHQTNPHPRLVGPFTA